MHRKNKLYSLLSCLTLFTFIVIAPLSAQEETPVVETTVNEEVPTEQPPAEEPTDVPIDSPTEAPTDVPTDEPVEEATEAPTDEPTEVPTDVPTVEPTEEVTDIPTEVPTIEATEEATEELVLVAPVFNLAQSSFETSSGLSLVIDLSVSDDNGIVRVVEDASATLGGVTVTAASEASADESGYITAVSVTYLAPAEYAGSDSFTLTAVDMTGESASLLISVNVLAAEAAEVTETPVEDTVQEVPEDTVQVATTYTVNNIGDAGDFNEGDGICDSDNVTAGSQCTLRAAIEQANANPGTDTIKFALASPYIIAPVSELETITAPVNITGTLGKVVLDGTGTVDSGLVLGAGSGGSKISGLVINNFTNAGVEVLNSDGNIISGNYIGVAANGTTAAGNDLAGVYIEASSNNMIGGGSAAARNIISGNGRGVFLSNGANGNIIAGNYIGTDKTGKVAIGNDPFAGVDIVDSSSNTIGGDAAGERNIISGNFNGVQIGGNSASNIVSGNYIGTDVSGKLALGNAVGGVGLDSSAGANTVGGDSTGERNIISGNGGDGITISIGGNNQIVSGNYIGTDVTGTQAIPNTFNGIGVHGSNNTIGGDVAGERNLISGNRDAGVLLNSSDNTVSGNYIGTDLTGTKAVPNGGDGIIIFSQNNLIGGDVAGERNLISGNIGSGVFIFAGNANTIIGNDIGTTAAGNKALPNGNNGVGIRSNDNIIGGDTPGERNVISGNLSHGVYINDGDGNTVQGNYIGTDKTGKKAVGNSFTGVTLENGANDNVVGGDVAAEGNVIAFNLEGVRVAASDGDTISHNSIFNNIRLGLDLDGGSGNNDIPRPSINTITTTQIDGEFPATIGDPYRIEVFSNVTCDSSGAGEGQTFLGEVPFTPAVSSPQPFSLVLGTALKPGVYITATVTNTDTGDTSEFSNCLVLSTKAVSAKPRLLTPTNNSIFYDGGFIDFSWGSAPLADRYRLEIATDKTFSNIIFTQDILVAATAFEFDAILELGDVLDDDDYYWRVRGANSVGNGPYSSPFKFTIASASMPILLKPVDESVTSDNTPTFSWKKLLGAASYAVSWTDDGSTDCVDIQFNGVSDFPTKTSFTPAAAQVLSEGTITWCVQAFDSQFNTSEFSEVWSFDVTLLKAPRDNSVTTDTTPTFTWNKAPGTGVTYRLLVDDDPLFGSPEIDEPGLTKTSFTPLAADALAASNGYYWRVEVTGGSWTVTDEIVWEFFVAPAKLVAPVLATPLNGAPNVNAGALVLDWNPVAAIPGVTIDYEIWVGNSPKFTGATIYTSGTDQVDISGDPDPGIRYYWKVRARYVAPSGVVVFGPFSQTRNFTTAP